MAKPNNDKYLDFISRYKVSEDGTCVSPSGKILSYGDRGHGYISVGHYSPNDKKATQVLLHRVLATKFLSNPLSLPFVNHIDGNKLNNSLDNLEWCTSSQNQKHAYSSGLKTPAKNCGGYGKKCIRETVSGFVYESIASASRSLGIDVSSISKYMRCKGYRFEFVNESDK